MKATIRKYLKRMKHKTGGRAMMILIENEGKEIPYFYLHASENSIEYNVKNDYLQHEIEDNNIDLHFDIIAIAIEYYTHQPIFMCDERTKRDVFQDVFIFFFFRVL